jgi:hypothetical protein
MGGLAGQARRGRPRHQESDLQVSIVDWWDRNVADTDAILFSIPNGGRRDGISGAILKAEGARAGMPDLVLLQQGARVTFIEMKAPEIRLGNTVVQKATRLSEAQREMHPKLRALGFRVEVVSTGGQFFRLVEELGVPYRAKPIWAFLPD